MPSSVQHLVAGLLHDLGARIVVLVDAMAEAHQPERIVLVLGAGDEFRNVFDRADLRQHFERRFVGAAMRRAPEAGDARRDAGERIGARRAGKPHRRSRSVLLVIGMQNEDAVERAGEHRIDLVFLARHREAHAQEIRGVVEIVLRIDERLADRIFERHRRDRRHFRDHAASMRPCAASDRKCRWSRDRRPTARRRSPPSPPSDARRAGSLGRSAPSAHAPLCGA